MQATGASPITRGVAAEDLGDPAGTPAALGPDRIALSDRGRSVTMPDFCVAQAMPPMRARHAAPD